MSRWIVSTLVVQCGHADGRHLIEPGRPVYLGPGIIRRCEDHAPCPVDPAQIDAARHALDASAAAARASVPSPASYVRRARPRGPCARVTLLRDGGGPGAAQARDTD